MPTSTSPRFAGSTRGLGIAVLSAASFGTSGTFATSLIDSGWSPAAVVTARLLIAALALTIPALRVMRGRWAAAAPATRPILAYGVIAVAGSQLCYFNAVQHLSVGIALLLEYLGTVLIVGWLWVRHGQRPHRLTMGGAVVVMAGLALMLGISGHQHVDLVGLVWGAGAAVGLATYFVLSADVDDAVPPIAMAWSAMVIGSVCLLLLGITGVLPIHVVTGDVILADRRTSWLVPVLGLSLIAAAFAYASGIAAARVLGAKLASFVGLSEVLFAVLFAWVLLGQHLGALQLAGGALVLAGVAIVRAGDVPAAVEHSGAEPVLTGVA
ncbi:MAG: DMT family transporter [Actinomycetota bacterium]|nr:DMT family transporter [Actinomycetota bacterium]